MTAHTFDPSEFAAAFQRFLEEIHHLVPSRSELHDKATTHLGEDPTNLPSVAVQLDASELPNLQLALDAIVAATPPDASELLGLPSEVRHYGGFSLASLLAGRMGPHIAATAPAYVDVPIGTDRTLPCVELGVYLLRVDDDEPIAVLVVAGMEHGPRAGLGIEVVARSRDVAAAFLARLRGLMHEHNVYRGKVLAFTFTEYGRFGVTFHRVPRLTRSDIILPEDDLQAIEQHTIDVSNHADELKAAGRHLKRGLLLYGPPGTGKTLSVMYLCNQLEGRTTLLVSGMGAGALGQAVAIARNLQPAMVVLEDVDLVAMERTMPGMGTNPLLFQLLNEMDGLAEDADVIFVLTTNRLEELDPVASTRPWRSASRMPMPADACSTCTSRASTTRSRPTSSARSSCAPQGSARPS